MAKNYYIQGDAANGERIKAAFEAKGINTSDWEFINNCDLYFNVGREIYTIDYSIKHIVTGRHDYAHLELPVEPKFKVGDWIIRNNGSSDVPIQVYGLKKDRYLVTNVLGSKGELMINRQDEWHLWTIEDAKEGDVLANNAGCIFINAGFEKDDKVTLDCYCYVSVQGDFYEEDHKTGSWLYASHIHPATKEQRILLFKKMQEAGYQWYAGKKELRKIKLHYDIANFKPFDKVLVRDHNADTWEVGWYGRYKGGTKHFVGTRWSKQCIPFEGNEHLLGTTKPCSEEYINW